MLFDFLQRIGGYWIGIGCDSQAINICLQFYTLKFNLPMYNTYLESVVNILTNLLNMKTMYCDFVVTLR
jgi:hypothetical protein